MPNKVWVMLVGAALGFLLGDVALAQAPRRRAPSSRQARRKPTVPKVGDVVPDFTLPDLKGKKVKLSGFKGKKIFVLELGACT